jgi:hypothetical protein
MEMMLADETILAEEMMAMLADEIMASCGR